MTVVAGVDDSPIARLVVEKAIEQARWRETDVRVVHVSYMSVTYADVPVDWETVAEAQRTAIWAQVDDLIGGTDVSVEKVDLDGYPPDTLVAYANANDASLLVVGSRGRGELASLVLGSTSHRAIHLSECDVLVVNATKHDGVDVGGTGM